MISAFPCHFAYNLPQMPIPKLSPAPGESYDASQKPPPFGHALKHYFALDDDYVNLNHGSSHVPDARNHILTHLFQDRMGRFLSP